jgi:uncharacterized Zn finger protein (UPF0148 family)
MPICPECESPVKDGELFCPMCGIALNLAPQPSVSTGPEPAAADDPFDGTIIMAPDELARMSDAAASGSSGQTASGAIEYSETAQEPASPPSSDGPAEGVFRFDEPSAPPFFCLK